MLPGVVGELDPIMTAAADNFLALAVVGFMKLNDALAVDRTGALTVVELVDGVDESGRIGLDRAPDTFPLDKILGVEVADSLGINNNKTSFKLVS